MTPTQLADYVVTELPQAQPEIDEFVDRLDANISGLPDEVKLYIYEKIMSKMGNIPCKRTPS